MTTPSPAVSVYYPVTMDGESGQLVWGTPVFVDAAGVPLVCQPPFALGAPNPATGKPTVQLLEEVFPGDPTSLPGVWWAGPGTTPPDYVPPGTPPPSTGEEEGEEGEEGEEEGEEAETLPGDLPEPGTADEAVTSPDAGAAASEEGEGIDLRGVDAGGIEPGSGPARESVEVAGVVGLSAEEIVAIPRPGRESVEVAGVVGLAAEEIVAIPRPSVGAAEAAGEGAAVAGPAAEWVEVGGVPPPAGEVGATLGTPLPTPRPEPAVEATVVGLAAGEIAAVAGPAYAIREADEAALAGSPEGFPDAAADSPVILSRAEVVPVEPAFGPAPLLVEAPADLRPAIPQPTLTAVPIFQLVEVEGLAPAGTDEGTAPPPATDSDERDPYGTEPQE